MRVTCQSCRKTFKVKVQKKVKGTDVPCPQCAKSVHIRGPKVVTSTNRWCPHIPNCYMGSECKKVQDRNCLMCGPVFDRSIGAHRVEVRV